MTVGSYKGKGKFAMKSAPNNSEKIRAMAFYQIVLKTYGKEYDEDDSVTTTATQENKSFLPMETRIITLVAVLRWYDAVKNTEPGEFHKTIANAIKNTDAFLKTKADFELMSEYCPSVLEYYENSYTSDNVKPVIELENKKLDSIYVHANRHAFKCFVAKMFINTESRKLINKYFFEVFACCFLERDNEDSEAKRLKTDIGRSLKLLFDERECLIQKEEVAEQCFEIVHTMADIDPFLDLDKRNETRIKELYKVEEMFVKKKRAFAEEAVSYMLLYEKDGAFKRSRLDNAEESDEE